MADEDDHYGHAAEIVYVQNRQMHEYSLKMQADYGKWLVSSLLVLHGAAISGLLFKGSAGNPPPFLHAITWFVIGVVLALATGFSAW
jgi:hypothetical protein